MIQSSLRQLPGRVSFPLLLAILLLGFGLRIWNLNFDRGIGSHPDERSTACFYATTLALPASWEQWRDPQRSPMNPLWDLQQQRPRSFTYGHLPLYMGVLMGDLFHVLAPVAGALGVPDDTVGLMQRADSACDAIAVAGRFTIALLDTLTIFLLYLLGSRVMGRAGGLLAASLYAFSAQAIQLSHFFAMDPASTTFTVLAVLGGVSLMERRKLWMALVTGAACGLAIASKFSALPVLVVPLVAALLMVWRALQESRSADGPLDGRTPFAAVVALVVAWGAACAAFFVTSPYAVLDWESFSRAVLIEQGMMVRGIADFPFTRQYRNTMPYLYFIQQQVQWGLGWALGLVAVSGTLYALFELLRSLLQVFVAGAASGRRSTMRRWLSDAQMANLVVWSWVLPYFGITGAFLAKFNRYMSPLLPFVLLWGAWLIVVLWRAGAQGKERGTLSDVADEAEAEDSVQAEPAVPGVLQSPIPSPPSVRVLRRLTGFYRPAALLLATLGVAGGFLWSLAYVNGVYNREHTWITASRWIYENVPQGSVILWELWDDPLPKSIPGELGMDMSSTGLANIDWSPYEEDTADKFEIMKQKLREADYVVYSSKRIYDSVDELPQRYPMTNLYYAAMWDGRLGFELAQEVTSPPRLFGIVFDDRNADESFSLYDHPQVSIFRKVRDLSDAEYDALFHRIWEEAVPGYRGKDSPLSPLLNMLGLGSQPGSENSGLINRAIALLGVGETAPTLPSTTGERAALTFDIPIQQLPIVDNYRWNTLASENTALAVVWWWLLLTLLGWLVWPIAFVVFRPLRDAGYFLSRTLGWLLGGWLLWLLVSAGLLRNTVLFAWLSVLTLAIVGGGFALRRRAELITYLRGNWKLLLVGEAVFTAAYLASIGVRLLNPDLWQPWFGGEKQMEFAFLNGILRSPTFPPVNPHFAGGYINYYYFGLYLVAYLIKLTGIYAEVAFNLTIATLFALTAVNVFAVAYSAAVNYLPIAASRAESEKPDGHRSAWKSGLGSALLAPLYVAVLGNLDGFAQLVRTLAAIEPTSFASAIPGLKPAVDAVAGFQQVAMGGVTLPLYDFWGPSRVLESTINEFPYWSFLFADLHPHIIGIPLSAMFLALTLVLLENAGTDWRRRWRYGVGLLATFALFLGALASVNLWELPTYLGLGVLAFLVSQFRGRGCIDWLATSVGSVLYAVGAYLLFWPFFSHYVNVGASGVGLVREPDPGGRWLLIWGFFFFVLATWLLFLAARPARAASLGGERVKPAGIERAASFFLRRFDDLPRVLHLHSLIVRQPSFLYLLLLALPAAMLLLALLALLAGWSVLALCVALLGMAVVLLWRRGQAADNGSTLAAVLAATGLAILAGTQIFYLKDFLDGSDYYRMNTLFKFFSQVWVIWGVAAAVATPRLLRWLFPGTASLSPRSRWRYAWAASFAALLIASLTYPIFGTPSRVDQRMPGWRPEIGTLNGLDFMRQGSYAWPDFNNVFELRYEWEALQWLLQNVRGNAVILESSEVEYYRAWGTRMASNTGLSGLKGMHEQEQRYPEEVGYRDGLHREVWSTPDIARTQQILNEVGVDLVYVGQLEHYLHPDGVQKFATMAEQGLLALLYENERATIYAVPGRLQQQADGAYIPS